MEDLFNDIEYGIIQSYRTMKGGIKFEQDENFKRRIRFDS